MSSIFHLNLKSFENYGEPEIDVY